MRVRKPVANLSSSNSSSSVLSDARMIEDKDAHDSVSKVKPKVLNDNKMPCAGGKTPESDNASVSGTNGILGGLDLLFRPGSDKDYCNATSVTFEHAIVDHSDVLKHCATFLSSEWICAMNLRICSNLVHVCYLKLNSCMSKHPNLRHPKLSDPKVIQLT